MDRCFVFPESAEPLVALFHMKFVGSSDVRSSLSIGSTRSAIAGRKLARKIAMALVGDAEMEA